jgi:hypothetical protein
MQTRDPEDREPRAAIPNLTVERMRRHLHANRRTHDAPWWGSLLDGPMRLGSAANEPPPDIA